MSNNLIKPSKFGALLSPTDPPPFTVLNGEYVSKLLLVCDHGGVAIPTILNGLDMDPMLLAHHISHDIGAANVTQLLSARLGAPAILFNYSRLVVDPNRQTDDPTVIREISDGFVIPGNRSLSVEHRNDRFNTLHRPYHKTITTMLDQVERRGLIPGIISIHSFTPVMKGFKRPWHIGVLTNIDRRMGEAFMANLAEDSDICIGDNKPYSGMSPYGYTIEKQALPKGYPNILIEIRQDLIDTKHGAERWSDRIAAALTDVLTDLQIFTPFQNQ